MKGKISKNKEKDFLNQKTKLLEQLFKKTLEPKRMSLYVFPKSVKTIAIGQKRKP